MPSRPTGVSGIPIALSWSLTDAKRSRVTQLVVANVDVNPALSAALSTVGAMTTIHPKAE